MTSDGKLAVVAVGGNSLIRDAQHIAIPYQAETAAVTAGYIAQMVADGWRVVVTHGNGPQVGFILRRSEIGQHEVPPIPMNYATSNTQGSIGYMFQRSFHNQFRHRGMDARAVALITQTLVDQDDPDFLRPTKPIGPHMSEANARKHAEEQGWAIVEDSGRGWRRVVASPRPKSILELDLIRELLSERTVVIACGGGGLPVYYDDNGDLTGIEAVVDKDYASSLLAQALGADLLLISTGVEKVAIHFGTPRQQWLDRMTLTEAKRYQAEGHFAAGSMGPKVGALIDYVEATGGRGVVTNPDHLIEAVAGGAGTTIEHG